MSLFGRNKQNSAELWQHISKYWLKSYYILVLSMPLRYVCIYVCDSNILIWSASFSLHGWKNLPPFIEKYCFFSKTQLPPLYVGSLLIHLGKMKLLCEVFCLKQCQFCFLYTCYQLTEIMWPLDWDSSWQYLMPDRLGSIKVSPPICYMSLNKS